ncbi:MAG: serine protein kinase RIO [Methanomicrobia archaeon]|nr:serine protein kinase RIO [Methanomicrobia archaeon]RLF95462.1 MAG: serine protein kinase RIO [Thermococci archaeon]HEC95397.1 serine protein kinase RIO [Euryarchaeota archaeon]RLF95879.1 MAG: serine protein kinase RIO [Thermococci archaeon]RLG01121.1 MAG: serine protein kinase RIO [Thermococci archaeon]
MACQEGVSGQELDVMVISLKYKEGIIKEKRLEKDPEIFRIKSEVFDHSTLMTIYNLQNRGYLDSVESIVSTGKEANIFYGLRKKRGVAIKIFRTATSSFRNIREYILSDPRFKGITCNRRKLTYAWAKREFKNLMRVYKKVKVPKPITVENNVLLMQFLGRKGVPYPRMKDIGPKDPEKDFEEIIDRIKTMYDIGIVHSDLSEYNILVNKEMYFIDFSQGTVLEDPNALNFLERDIKNIIRYFSDYIETPEFEEIYKKILR